MSKLWYSIDFIDLSGIISQNEILSRKRHWNFYNVHIYMVIIGNDGTRYDHILNIIALLRIIPTTNKT